MACLQVVLVLPVQEPSVTPGHLCPLGIKEAFPPVPGHCHQLGEGPGLSFL